LIKAAVLYCIRGLTIARRGGGGSGKGSVKAARLAGGSGRFLRAGRSARARRLLVGWVLPRAGGRQAGFKRHGAYFEINLGWRLRSPARASAANRVRPRPSDSRPATSPGVREFAPPVAQVCTAFAPPYETKKTSSNEESKNQKTHRPERPGVF